MGLKTTFPIILASASPRRRELLSALDIDFEVIPSDVDESIEGKILIKDIPEILAKRKARAIFNKYSNHVVIGVDTIVCCEEQMLGKPKSHGEAISMISNIQGKQHEVLSGVYMISPETEFGFTESTIVEFDNLDQKEVEHYVSKYQPLDKAGAYGIQEWIGHIGVSKIQGNYNNVVGLPTQQLYRRLKQVGVILPG